MVPSAAISWVYLSFPCWSFAWEGHDHEELISNTEGTVYSIRKSPERQERPMGGGPIFRSPIQMPPCCCFLWRCPEAQSYYPDVCAHVVRVTVSCVFATLFSCSLPQNCCPMPADQGQACFLATAIPLGLNSPSGITIQRGLDMSDQAPAPQDLRDPRVHAYTSIDCKPPTRCQ